MLREKEIGLAMIKPESLKQGLDVPIRILFEQATNTCSPLVDYYIKGGLGLRPSEDFGITIVKTIMRRLDTEKATKLRDIFYQEAKGKRFYPYLLDILSEEVIFFLLRSDDFNIYEIFPRIKGNVCLIDQEGRIKTVGKGIRGLLTPPSVFIPPDRLEEMPEEEYYHKIRTILNNVIHFADTPEQTARALSVILSKWDIEELASRGILIEGFISRYSPR